MTGLKINTKGTSVLADHYHWAHGELLSLTVTGLLQNRLVDFTQLHRNDN